MAQVKYVGGIDEIELAAPSGEILRVKMNGVLTVADPAFAKLLLDQSSNFIPVDPAAVKLAPKDAEAPAEADTAPVAQGEEG